MDFRGELHLDDLWITPAQARYPREDGYQSWPHDRCLLPPLPYELGVTVEQIEEYYLTRYEYTPGSIQIALINDVFDLELAQSLADRAAQDAGYITGGQRTYLVDSVTFHTLAQTAILVMERNSQIRFPQPQTIVHLPRQTSRWTVQHWDESRNNSASGRPVFNAERLQSGKLWPHRRVKQLPPVIFPERSSNQPYVIILHQPTMRAFAVNGGYQLLDREVSDQELLDAMRYHTQVDEGWMPSGADQRPAWARDLPTEQFIAYWISQ